MTIEVKAEGDVSGFFCVIDTPLLVEGFCDSRTVFVVSDEKDCVANVDMPDETRVLDGLLAEGEDRGVCGDWTPGDNSTVDLDNVGAVPRVWPEGAETPVPLKTPVGNGVCATLPDEGILAGRVAEPTACVDEPKLIKFGRLPENVESFEHWSATTGPN